MRHRSGLHGEACPELRGVAACPSSSTSHEATTEEEHSERSEAVREARAVAPQPSLPPAERERSKRAIKGSEASRTLIGNAKRSA